MEEVLGLYGVQPRHSRHRRRVSRATLHDANKKPQSIVKTVTCANPRGDGVEPELIAPARASGRKPGGDLLSDASSARFRFAW